MSKVTVDFNTPFTDLKGQPVASSDGSSVKLGERLASVLSVMPSQSNQLKIYGWAEDLSQGKSLTLDEDDKRLLHEKISAIDNPQLATGAMQAQWLRVLDRAKPAIAEKSIVEEKTRSNKS